MDTHVPNLEEKALKLLACTAVFWSFFIAAGMLVQTFAHMQDEAYASAFTESNYATIVQANIDAERYLQMRQHPPLPPLQSSSTPPRPDGEHEWVDSSSTPHTMPPRSEWEHGWKNSSSTGMHEGMHCPRPSMALQRGGEHNMPDQVKELQQFLADRYQQKTEDMVTGHFGSVTERFIAKFQEEQGLPPLGIVGPMTRMALLRACGGGTASSTPGAMWPPPHGSSTSPWEKHGSTSPEKRQGYVRGSGMLSAAPATGTSPLSVTFTVKGDAGSYTLIFGDGATTTVAIPSIQCITTPCNPPAQTVDHTYQNAGVYKAKLKDQKLGSEKILGGAFIVVTTSSQ